LTCVGRTRPRIALSIAASTGLHLDPAEAYPR
jgi:hypothetical protein